MLCCSTDVRLVTVSTHTIHQNPTSSRVISITLISFDILLIISPFILLYLIDKLGGRLGQVLAILLERMLHLFLMLKFPLLN